MQAAECDRNGALIKIEIQADGFLYGMVRLLVGMLVQVGIGKMSLERFTHIWQNQLREEVRYAAPAKGLCLLRVGYPDFPFPPQDCYDTHPQYFFEQLNKEVVSK